mgnify:CR=1 FL=1
MMLMTKCSRRYRSVKLMQSFMPAEILILQKKKGYTLTNTAWTYSMMAVTDEKYFNENEVHTSSMCQRKKEALKQHYYFQLSQLEAG